MQVVQEVIGFQEPRGWPRSYEVNIPSTGGSGVHWDFRRSRGGQEDMGSRDLAQEFRGSSGFQEPKGGIRRLWGQGT